MPNHCCNLLIMSKASLPIITKKYVRRDEDRNKIFDFELIEPIGDVPDSYNHRMEKWGTKWCGYDLNIGESVLDFYTAWSPPIPIIKKLAELHKDLVFRLEYYEAGISFRGTATAKWQDGEALLEDNWRYMTDDDLIELGLMAPEDKTE